MNKDVINEKNATSFIGKYYKYNNHIVCIVGYKKDDPDCVVIATKSSNIFLYNLIDYYKHNKTIWELENKFIHYKSGIGITIHSLSSIL